MKKGPEISLKPPQVLTDLYADLRDRHLLPLVVLLLAGIVAAPVLLGDEKEEEPFAPAPAPPQKAVDPASFTVVPAEPQLRDYRRRLEGRQAQNPFEPAISTSSPDASGAGDGGESSSGEGAAAGGGSAAESVESLPPDTSESSTQNYRITPAVDLRLGVAGNVHPRPAVPALTKLPSPKNPIVVFMGISKRKQPLFLVTSRVNSYQGPVRCAVDKFNCQLLEVVGRAPVDFAFGPNNHHFLLTVEEIVAIVRGEGITRVVRDGGTRDGRGGSDGGRSPGPIRR